jgi:transporter family-2 protein
VSGGNAVAVLLSLAAGVGGSVQAAVMGKLGERVGAAGAVGFAGVVAGLAGVAVMLVGQRSFHAVPASLRQPAWLWTGGLLSAFIVLTITFAAPRLGVAAAIGLVIAGNLVMAAVIDQFGLFGFGRIALHWPRLLGIALLAAGAALSLRK